MGLFGRDKTQERLEQLDSYIESEWTPAPDSTSSAAIDTKTMREQMAARLDNLLDQRGIASNIRAQLRKADLKLTVSEYLLMHLVLAVLFALVAYIVRGWFGAGVGFIAGLFAPRIYVTMKRNRRLKAFDNQLGDILNLWVNSLRAGYSVPQAMEAVAKEAPPPANSEFRRVVSEMSIGIPMDTALNNMLARIGSEDLDLVFTAVSIQREVGGNLAEILDTISETIRERVRIKGEIRTLTTSGRTTGTVIGLLPILLALFLMFVNPSYMGQLFFGPEKGGAFLPFAPIPCGWPLVACGLSMMAIGIAIINKIVSIEV
nr:type II secretion system F family protein [Anaerolineae bacterium]